MWCILFIDFCILNYPWVEANLWVVNDLFGFPSILLRILHLCSPGELAYNFIFVAVSLSGFNICNIDSIKPVVVLLPFLVYEVVRRAWHYFFTHLVEFSSEYMWVWTFIFLRNFFEVSVSIACYRSVQIVYTLLV